LLALFPDSETELRSAIRKGDLLSSESGDFAEPHVLTTPFQTLMLITSDFLQDRIARTCIGALTFWTPVTWEAAMKDSKITASESVIAIPKNEDESLERSNAALLYAGLLRILHHMEAFRDFWRAFIDSDLVQETDPVALLRRVQQIQRWRVNLGSSQTFSRVHQLVADLQSKLTSELKDNRASNDAERSLIVSIANFPDFALSLVSFWSGSGQALAATV
jgi:hypothetical protein